MRRGRGGGGGLFYYTRCAENCCFTSPTPPSSTVLNSPNPKVSSRIFKVPTFLFLFSFFDRSNHFCGRHLAVNTTSRRLGENFKPPAAAAQETRIPQGSSNTSPFATFIWLVWKLTLTSAKLDRPHLPGIMTRRSCAIYATGIVCAHLLIVGIALLVAQVFQTMIHNRLKQVSYGPTQP